MKTGALIVAAGMSSRMNDFKPMMQIGSISIIQRVIETLLQAGADPVVVVTGFQSKQLERHLSKHNVLCIPNPDYETTQMLDSAKIGLSYLQDKCDRILFTPADIPLFTVITVEKIMASRQMLAKPVKNNIGGHPILIDNQLISTILTYQGEGGLKSALKSTNATMEYIEVEDEGILLDADTKEDYENLLTHHNNQLLRPKIKLQLAKEVMFFDERSAALLHLIHENSSIRQACEQVNISYRKGFNLINQMEQQLVIQIVVRHQGGTEGGYSELTEAGKELLRKYDSFVEESTAAVNQIYKKIFDTKEE